MSQHLTVKRKADRKKMALAVAELARRYGFSAEVKLDSPEVYNGRCTKVGIKGPRGVSVGVEFNGDSCQPDTFVCTWNTPAPRSTLRMFGKDGETVSFSTRFDNLSRPKPYGGVFKATRVWEGWHVLIQYLEFDLEAINDGSAFDDALAAKYDGHVERGEMPWQVIGKAQREGRMGALLR